MPQGAGRAAWPDHAVAVRGTAGESARKEQTVSRRGWLLFAAMSVIWGIPYLLIKVAVGGVPVPVLVLARVLIGAALLVPIAARLGPRRGLRPPPPRKATSH